LPDARRPKPEARGLTPRWIVSPSEAGSRLDKFLSAPDRLASRSRASAAIERGKVFVDDEEARVEDGGRRLRAGETIAVWADRPGTAVRRPGPYKSGALHILYEDDAIIVLDKPAGMLSVPLERRPGAPSAFDLIESHLRPSGKRRPLVVHRIDLDTSGLVVFAKTPRAQAALKAQFRRREPERIYWAVVHGHVSPPDGTWRDRLFWDRKALVQREVRPDDPRGVEAIAGYRVMEAFADASLVEIRLTTGKQNQIRVQAALRGHQLVGERRYVSRDGVSSLIPFSRQALHSRQLAFQHPITGAELRFEAPLPDDVAQLLERLRPSRRSSKPEA
jgi:23S rRNA pseudouridine1911/1915/1917 synthase